MGSELGQRDSHQIHLNLFHQLNRINTGFSSDAEHSGRGRRTQSGPLVASSVLRVACEPSPVEAQRPPRTRRHGELAPLGKLLCGSTGERRKTFDEFLPNIRSIR